MPKVCASAIVPSTAEEAFEFIADYRNIPRLQPQFRSAKLVGAIERGQGAVVELDGRFHGMPMKVRNRIVTYAPGHRLVSISEGNVLSRNTWEFEPLSTDPSTTRVTLTIEYKVAGPLGGLFTGVASSFFHRDVQEMTDDSLRRLGDFFRDKGGT